MRDINEILINGYNPLQGRGVESNHTTPVQGGAHQRSPALCRPSQTLLTLRLRVTISRALKMDQYFMTPSTSLMKLVPFAPRLSTLLKPSKPKHQ